MAGQTRLWLISQGLSPRQVDNLPRSDFEDFVVLFTKGIVGWFSDSASAFMIVDRLDAILRTMASMGGSRQLPPRRGFAETFPHHTKLMQGGQKEDLTSQVMRWRGKNMLLDPAYDHSIRDGGGYDMQEA